jgi:GNAT superfamily N-acetyltransferase
MKNRIHFKHLCDIGQGNVYSFLRQSYDQYIAIDPDFEAKWQSNWQEFDDLVFKQFSPEAVTFGFSTYLDNTPIGLSSWDPCEFPKAIVGHNCILPEYRGNGLGYIQMNETINRLKTAGYTHAIVTTGEANFFVPAQKMYMKNGFVETVRDYSDNASKYRTIHYALEL